MSGSAEGGYMPHGFCFQWQPELLWTIVGSEAVIALSYFSIPLVLLYFSAKRPDLRFNRIFKLFSLFIFACGVTHLLGIWIIWHPDYWLDALVKALTAAVSLPAAALLLPLLPKLLKLPSIAQLETLVGKLQCEVEQRKAAEAELLRLKSVSEERFRILFESTRDALIVAAPDGAFLGGNPAAVEMFGCRDLAEFAGLNPTAVSPEFQADGRPSAEISRQMLGLALQKGSHYFEWTLKRKDGGEFPVDILLTRIRLGEETVVLASVRDISERKQAEARLQLAARVFTHAREGIIITDANGTIVDVNATFTEITGYSREEAVGRNPKFLQSGMQNAEYYAEMWETLLSAGHWSREIWNRNKGGAVFPELITISTVCDPTGRVQNYVALFTDITTQKKHQQQLELIAHFDQLTQLPNRVLLADRLQQAMLRCQRRRDMLAVVYLDLDGFKTVNDTYGHEVGDKLLVTVAQRMKSALRDGDTLARFGGDEFVAVLADLEKPLDCEPVLERLLQAAADSVIMAEQVLQVTASIGITLYPQDGADAEQLIRHADQAMYQAKQAGKNRYHLFDVNYDKAVKLRQDSLEEIRRALAGKQFELYFQPKVHMRSGEVIGVEALLRWRHPQRGLLLPAEFLPQIENHPLELQLGHAVLVMALEQRAAWLAAGLQIAVSVNIAACHLQDEHFAGDLQGLLAAYPEMSPAGLELEILETVALQDIIKVSDTMRACSALGVSFALDDFGTGYSSLTYFKKLPAHLLKIDQSFVRDILNDPDDLAIVTAVVGLARNFNRQVLAEGVETMAHGELLLSLGCDLAQGYGIARPMPAQELPGWIAAWRPPAAWAGIPNTAPDPELL